MGSATFSLSVFFVFTEWLPFAKSASLCHHGFKEAFRMNELTVTVHL